MTPDGMPRQGRLLAGAAIALLAAVAALGDRGDGPPKTAPSSPSPALGSVGGSSWAPHLRHMVAALAQGNVRVAELAWQRAYREALRSREWAPLLEVGHAGLRLGKGGKAPSTATQRARQAYLDALLRARKQRSLDGVLRAAGAFAALGDREVVAGSLRIAEVLAEAEGPAARERVAAARRRLAPSNPEAEGQPAPP